jgi:hypothetical protein
MKTSLFSGSRVALGFPLMPLGLLLSLVFSVPPGVSAGELRVPAFTAYLAPNSDAARVSEKRGITRWNDPKQAVQWYGKFERTGQITVKVELNLPIGATSKLKLSVKNQSKEISVQGLGSDMLATADFGSFAIATSGHHRLKLESLNAEGTPAGDLQTLVIDGDAADNAHFNLKERRNAASVHLKYLVPEGAEVAAFYSEVTAIEDPTTTFYMACGWHRGYFGMQVNSPTERRIIFSVWDSGNEAVDRKKVDVVNRVQLVGKGEGVYSGDFGNEGTGGHSHLKYVWKTGEKQRFVVTAQPVEKTFTVFSGYWFHPDQKDWMLISSWKAPKEGGWLKGLHGFSENFGGSNGDLLRKALYGNQWVQTSGDKWFELTQARFSHDPTGKSDRLDRFMGVENGQFFLSHGGFVDGFSKYGDEFSRAPLGVPPSIPKADSTSK